MNVPATPPLPASHQELLLDAISTALLLVDQDYRVCYMNPAAEAMLRFSRKQARRRTLDKLFPGYSLIDQALSKARDQHQSFSERNLMLRLQDGHRLTVDCVITPTAYDGQPGFLAIELTQVDRHLRISREDHLIHQGVGSRELLRGMAHEIKNPLGGIRGAAQLLAAELALEDESLAEYTTVIIQEVDRLHDLIDRMLGPRQLPSFKATNIHEVLERVHRLVRVEAKIDTAIIRDYDPSLPPLQADADMLQQAFLNLVRNALQAVAGQDKPEICLRTRMERQFTISHQTHRLVLKIEIIDNGPGIAPEMLESIFLPMVSSKSGGSGLGLPIAQTLVQRHGGLIECDSQDGQTRFTVYLPLETPHASNE